MDVQARWICRRAGGVASPEVDSAHTIAEVPPVEYALKGGK